ncbi:MAG TPA: dTMP kinase [Wenzhouxiangella sp.]
MTHRSHGYLITLEGGEGAGKTTAAAMIREWLEAKGREVVMTREPGGTPLAERIRAVLLDPEVKAMSPTTELLLMFAARSENLDRLIRPALAKGQDVVCDRFTDASRAYQGAGRELGLERVDLLAEVVHGDLSPDLTLLLDVPVELGMERVGQRGDKLNRFELAEQAFFERVRQGYLDQAAKEPHRFCVINAAQGLKEVQADILAALEHRLVGLA